MARVRAYHVILGMYGFWLPNDPRGSGSYTIRAEHLEEYGRATKTHERRSVARKPHDHRLRRTAKKALMFPEVLLSGKQALSIANGFGEMIRKSDYVVHACSILPAHIHMVIARHHYKIEQVVRLLRQAGTLRLLQDNLHPFASLRDENDKLPSVWQQKMRKVYLFTDEEILRAIRYVEDNPLKDGKPRQHWKFVTPFVPKQVSVASAKRR